MLIQPPEYLLPLIANVSGRVDTVALAPVPHETRGLSLPVEGHEEFFSLPNRNIIDVSLIIITGVWEAPGLFII